MFKLSTWVSALLLMVNAAVAKADGPYDGQFYFVLRDSAPCASSEIANRFSGLSGLTSSTLWLGFEGRTRSFKESVSHEAQIWGDRLVSDLQGLNGSLRNEQAQLDALSRELRDSVQELPNSASGPQSDASAGHVFLSSDPEFLGRARVVHRRLQASHPADEIKRSAKDVALNAIEAADQSVAAGDREAGMTVLSAAEELADFALGVTPGISVGKDLYEAVTGKRLINGETLTGLERGLAVVGVLSLGLSSEITGVGRVLSRIGQRVGAAGLEQGIRVGERIAAAMGTNGLEKFARREYSENAIAFVGKLTGTERAASMSVEAYNDLAREYTRLEGIIRGLPGRVIEGIETRAVPREISMSDRVVRNSPDTVFDTHTRMKFSEGRYSIGGEFGDKALYTVIGSGPEAEALALRESRLVSESSIIASRSFRAEKVLDLGDTELLERLGIQSSALETNIYDLPQLIGDIARSHGFDGLKVKSTFSDSMFNFVRFLE